MEYIQTDNGISLLGQGEAVVLEVKSGTEDNHQVKIRHPDLGETRFIPYIQTSGLYKVPAVGDICYVFAKEGFSSYPMAWGSKLHDSAVKALLGSRDNRTTVLYSTGPDNKSISHKIELDDGESRGIRVTTQGGNLIELKNGEDIIIKQVDGSVATFNKEGIKLTTGGSTITMTSDSIDIETSTLNIKADEVNAEASGSKVKLDKSFNVTSSDKLATIDTVVIFTHDHNVGNLGFPTGGGPTKTGESL